MTRDFSTTTLDAAEAVAADELCRLLAGFPRDVSRQAVALIAARFKPARKPPKPRLNTLIKRAEAATGKTVTAITTLANGSTKLDLGGQDEQQQNALDEWIAKHARAPERH